jgi:hypothetical protein
LLTKAFIRAALVNALQVRYSRARGRRIVHVLHIGKTGGTAIRHALEPYRTTPGCHLVFHHHDKTLMNVPRGDLIVLFLREPLSRFVSGFYSRQRQGQPRFFKRWTDGEAVAFTRFATPNDLALGLSAEDAGRRAHAEEAMRSIEHVRDGLRVWLGSESTLRSRLPDILFIGFQETLATDFERLVSRLGLKASVRLPDDDVAAHRNPRDRDRTLAPAAVENLRRWYAADLSLYELCRELSASLAGTRPGIL